MVLKSAKMGSDLSYTERPDPGTQVQNESKRGQKLPILDYFLSQNLPIFSNISIDIGIC